MPARFWTLLYVVCAVLPARASTLVPVVAAERVYGSVAEAIGGRQVRVTSILRSPVQDPHVFEPNPSAARAVAEARLVIVNGAGYDAWMDLLLGAGGEAGRQVIRVAALAQAGPGTNPHLWYSTATMRLVARAIAEDLGRLDPGAAPAFDAAEVRLMASLGGLDARIAAMRARYHGVAVAATEPVFGPMLTALGLTVRDMRFEVSVMNGTEPRASDIAAVEADLRGHTVRALLFNAQVSNAATHRLVDIARRAGVPVVGVTESLPDGQDYTGWMLSELNTLDAALASARP
jgi:zinc/manganese transport system substrate-binding protein